MVCIGANEYKGKRLIFVRIFAYIKDQDAPITTSAGVSLPVEKYPNLLAGVQALLGNAEPEKVTASPPAPAGESSK